MIQTTYHDVFGHEHVVPTRTVERLEAALGGPARSRPRFVRPGDDLSPGYHFSEGLIVSPGVCHLPAGRRWGWAVQLYASRSERSWGIGDFADLRQLGEWAATCGAGMLLVNPLHAVAPGFPQGASPYFPASRRFLNPIYLRLDEVTGIPRSAVAEAEAAGRELNHLPVIDRDAVWRLKLSLLEQAWKDGPPRGEFDEWREEQGGGLEEFGVWATLAEEYGGDWRDWPPSFASPPVESPVDADRAVFHQWLQWLCRQQLEAAAAVPLVHDLPIGMDPGGVDAWVWQDLLALDMAVGAPPDEFNTLGQNWGLPPFVPDRLAEAGYGPLAATIRESTPKGGGLRIDHVMGLFRQFWIPDGATPGEGGYVRFPADEMLDIVALESHRAGAMVIGEDLGTVEEGVREELAARRMLSYRVLWFEEDDPASWPELSMASVTTHDLPTVVGLWSGEDLAEQEELGLAPNREGTAEMLAGVREWTGLGRDAPLDEVVLGVHRRLARTPSRMLCATLDDVALAPRRPNIPGADDRRPNWSLPLPVSLETLMASELAQELAMVFNEAISEEES